MDHQTVALVLKGTFGIGLSVHNGKTSQNVLTIFVMEVSLYLGMADLLFYKFGFSCFVMVELAIDLLVRLNPNQ